MVISSLAIFVTTILFQRPLVTLFTDKDTSVYRIALQGFAIFTFSLLFSGFNIFSSAMFTALSQGRLSALISFSRTFGFYLLFLLILPRWLGSRGVWLAIVLAEGCSLLVSLLSIQRHTLTCHLADRKKEPSVLDGFMMHIRMPVHPFLQERIGCQCNDIACCGLYQIPRDTGPVKAASFD